MDPDTFSLIALSVVGGALTGAASLTLARKFRIGGTKVIADQILTRAQQEAERAKHEAEITIKKSGLDHQRELDNFVQQERKKIEKEETRLQAKEDKVEARMQLVEKKLQDIEKREAVLIGRRSQLEDEKKLTAETYQKLLHELEQISGLSSHEAKDALMNRLVHDVKQEAANFIRKSKKEAEEQAELHARSVIAGAINRLASSHASEATICTVSLPNDEMKGRIIGREGRNIRALEQATGVNFIIDDTPGAVVISGFDPIRKQIAKLALGELVMDGRIHPTRIEEVVAKAAMSIQKLIRQYGEDAALRAGVMNLHPDIILMLGKLKFRFSLGQNVLDHSLEVSHLMGLIAAELGLDVKLAKRIGLLHDMGKAVTHEVEGTHAMIGHDVALRCGESKEVANGIGCHHGEMEPTTVEASLCSAADALSASRPGARVEAVEEYIRRLKRLEDLAFEFPGVEKAYAMQAGREIRVVVLPDQIDDDGTINLARDLSKRVEAELQYPGKIKITIIREKRAIEYAM